jgi:putative NADPH-quinone reductase
MSKILVVLAHPNIESSLGNRTIVEKFKSLHPEAEIDELYKLYPDFRIDVKREQQKLLKADYIILQFPMYWYNAPALLRQWFESVLEHGFAYGSTGKALQGKKLILSITTGSPFDAYRVGGVQNFSIEDLTKGFHQLANLCSMKWEGFIVTGNLVFLLRDKPEEMKKMMERLERHAQELSAKINGKYNYHYFAK